MHRDALLFTLPNRPCRGWWAWRAWHVGGDAAAGGSGDQT